MAKKQKLQYRWLISIFLITFICSMIFSYASTEAMQKLSLGLSILVLSLIIGIGIISDIIAISVTTADITSLHAKASNKIKGSKTAIKLVNNAPRVSSICGDVVGDICGVLSGSAGLLIAIKVSELYNIKLIITSLIIGGMIAAVMITLKAIFKGVSINNADEIVTFVSKILEFYKK